MARITKQSVEKLKDIVQLSDVFEWLGAKVVRGHNTMAFCPFCEDANSKSPGCSLSDTLGLYHCFVCGESGDMIGAVMKHEECSFPEAVERIASQFNVPLEYEESNDPEAESRHKLLTSILEAAQEEFLAQRSDEHYSGFLEERHISEEDAEKFELGISLYTEAPSVIRKLKAKGFTDHDLVDAGLCFHNQRTGEVDLHFKNRITFPIRTAPGTLVGFGGRDLTGKSKAKYKNSPESTLFKKRSVLYGMNLAKKAMSKTKRAIVCEGYMDTLALQTHGFEYTVGAMGTALTEYNLKKIGNFAETIYISLDSDQAGINAAMRTAETIPAKFSSAVKVLIIPEVECHSEEEVRRTSLAKADEYLYRTVEKNGKSEKVMVDFPVMVPMAKDPDEFFNQVGHTTEEFEQIIAESKDIFLFCVMMKIRGNVAKINAEIEKEMPDIVAINQEKVEAKRTVAEFINKIYHKTNIYQRQNIANYMIATLRLMDTFEKLENEWRMRANTSSSYKNAQPAQKPTVVAKKEDTYEQDLLIATLYFHQEYRTLLMENIDDLDDVFNSALRASIYKKIDSAYSRGLSSKDATNEMTPEETAELSRIVMEAGENGTSDATPDVIASVCKQAELKAIRNQIDKESNAASPDVMKIIELKMKLAELE